MVEQLPIEVVVRHIEECGYLPIGCLQFVLRSFPAQVHVWRECQNAGIKRNWNAGIDLVVAIPRWNQELVVHNTDYLDLVPWRSLGEHQPELRLILRCLPVWGVVNLEPQNTAFR